MKALVIVTAAALLVLGCDSHVQKTKYSDVKWRDTKALVYGDDDRIEVSAADQSMATLANSTVALMKKNTLTATSTGFKAPSASFGSSYGLCATEPFFDQPNPAFCSGFLIAPNKIVTAGHCIGDQPSCENIAFVFGFHQKSSADETVNLPQENVYYCKTLMGRDERFAGPDWAIVELDRPVLGRSPLSYRTADEPQISTGTDLVVIGHPAGLPTKVAGGASVRSIENGYFIANLDTYGGNSGSAVFNKDTKKVEGILVRGDRDFVYENGCRQSNVCPDDGCRGEDVTLITEVCDLGATACQSNDDPVDEPVDQPVDEPVDTVDPVDPVDQPADPIIPVDGDNSCQYANDNVCDDGRTGAAYDVCLPGTDENDCTANTQPGDNPEANSCQWANDGTCDDGRPGAPYNVCQSGTDENDCSGPQ